MFKNLSIILKARQWNNEDLHQQTWESYTYQAVQKTVAKSMFILLNKEEDGCKCKKSENAELLSGVGEIFMATQNKDLAMQIETDSHDFIKTTACSTTEMSCMQESY